MKVQPRDIENFVKNPPKNICAVLIYGPDEGLARERLNKFTTNVVPDLQDPFNIVDINSSTLNENPALLSDEVLSISIRITSYNVCYTKLLRSIINSLSGIFK